MLRQTYCKDSVSIFLLMVYTSLLQTGNGRYQLIDSEFKVARFTAFLRYSLLVNFFLTLGKCCLDYCWEVCFYFPVIE